MRFFSSDGVDIAFVDLAAAGEGPGRGRPIVLVHGFASNHAVNWVGTFWTTTLARAGWRVIALDNRGHGSSGKPRDPAAYHSAIMASDVTRLMDHLGLERAAVMGYSMGARITAFLAVHHAERLTAALLGGLGIHLVDGVGLPTSIAAAMEAETLADLTDPTERMFRAFAEQTKSDLLALAACIRGSRQTLTAAEVGAIRLPVQIAIGTKDAVSGAGEPLAALIPGARFLSIPGRDHNLAVGDKVHKQGVLAFLEALDPV